MYLFGIAVVFKSEATTYETKYNLTGYLSIKINDYM